MRRSRQACVLSVLLATPLTMIVWQHQQLQSVGEFKHERQPHRHRQPQPITMTTSEMAPPPPPVPALAFENGERMGNTSESRVCIVMPVRSSNLRRAVRNAHSWSLARGMPCATSETPDVDLCVFHSQSFASSRDVALASEFAHALSQPSMLATNSTPMPSSPGACFGAVRFLAARIPLDVDVYTIYPIHNFTGPNTHFLSTFSALDRVAAAGLAHYHAFQLMETDTYAFRPGWAEALGHVARHRKKEWVLGSKSMCLRPTEVEHINGNALYAHDKTFVRELRREMAKRFDSWAFDVLIGRWLLRKHPQRIRESKHVLSISTFQRNRSCCELVRSIVRRGGGEVVLRADEPSTVVSRRDVVPSDSVWPGLYLLHTGNIGKLRDSSVPPSMRVLGLALQDLLVPRLDEPCVLDSNLPTHLARCYRATMLWRARLKGQGDCKLNTPTPTPLVWAHTLAPAASMLRQGRRSFVVHLRHVDWGGSDGGKGGGEGGKGGGGEGGDGGGGEGGDGGGSEGGGGEDGEGGGGEGASANGFVGPHLSTLLSHVPAGGIGQLVVWLPPPVETLWRAFRQECARASAVGNAPPELSEWLTRVDPNPVVTSLSRCTDSNGAADRLSVGRADGGGMAAGVAALPRTASNSTSVDEPDSLAAARTVLQERALTMILEANASARTLGVLGRFFDWGHRNTSDEAAGRDGHDSQSALLPLHPDSTPPAEAAALLKKHVALDVRLYEYARRLADEQHRSVVWVEEDTGDTCAAAEAAGEAASSSKAVALPLALDERTTFTWDGDTYKVVELTLTPPFHAVQLLVRGKSVIGSSPFTVNVLISHRTTHPSFAERAFRYVYESKPPHRRAGKFVLGAERLTACCVETAEAEADARGVPINATGACTAAAGRPLTLWIAFKCRSVAVSSLTAVAQLAGTKAKI